MPRFFYIASTQEGEIKKGLVEAPDRDTLINKLQKSDLVVISVERKKQSQALKNFKDRFAVLGKIKTVDKILFARHLSALIKGGVSLGEGLGILKKGSSNPKMKRVLDELIMASKSGRSLHSSMAEHPKVFNHYFINMIKTGEEGGTLDENLERLADELKKSDDLKKKIKGVMIYPTIIVTVTVVMGIGLTVYIVPKLNKLFESFAVDLPLSTRIFLSITTFLQNYGLYVFIGIGVLFFGLTAFAKTKIGRPIVHKVILMIPVAGKISRNINMAQFSRTLGTLLKSGIHIMEALTITAGSLNNAVYEMKIKKSIAEVQRGVPVSVILERESELFPVLATSVISIGEKIGKLDETLLFVSEFYEEEVDNITKNLSTLIEPALMITIGLAVGGMAFAIITPIYQISGQI